MTNEELKARVEIVKAMNTYVLDIIGDDDITETWLTYGVPDGANDNDLMDYLEDEDTFEEWIAMFKNCLYRANR